MSFGWQHRVDPREITNLQKCAEFGNSVGTASYPDKVESSGRHTAVTSIRQVHVPVLGIPISAIHQILLGQDHHLLRFDVVVRLERPICRERPTSTTRSLILYGRDCAFCTPIDCCGHCGCWCSGRNSCSTNDRHGVDDLVVCVSEDQVVSLGIWMFCVTYLAGGL
jgi:hypothetical protein